MSFCRLIDAQLLRVGRNDWLRVSVCEMEPEADALRLFLDSIEKCLPLDPDKLTLPSYGKPFRGCILVLHNCKRIIADSRNMFRRPLMKYLPPLAEKP